MRRMLTERSKGLNSGFSASSQRSGGIVVEQAGVDAADGGCGVLYMGADEGVPVSAVAYLNPCHINLNQCRAAPLARFENNHSYGSEGRTVGLEEGEHLTLRSVEDEGHQEAGGLVLYCDAHAAPVLEVVAHAELLPQRLGEGSSRVFGVVEHGRREETFAGCVGCNGDERQGCASALAAAAFAGERVVGGATASGTAARVFLEEIF